MIAAILLLLPFLAALVIAFAGGGAGKRLALGVSLLEFVITLVAWYQFNMNDTRQIMLNIPWVSLLGIHFNIGIDGVSMILVLLTGLLYPFIIGTTLKNEVKNPKAFYSLMMLMQLGLMGVFIARDAFLFYVFYELTLIPIYFICAIWGGEGRIPITLKFFIYTMAGSLFMLIAIIYLYFKTPGSHTFDIATFYTLQLSPTEQTWIFWAFFLAFAIKIPVFPFHTWQPDTYTVSPAAGTMLLAGIMLKMGIYGLIRFVLPIVPDGVTQWGNCAMILCIIGIVYASVIALQQQDLKTLVAYSSIAHVGLIAAGVFSLTTAGLQGAVLQMFNHGVNVVAMFFMIDILENRYGTRWMDDLGGVAGQMKKFGVMFMIILLGSVGLPLTNGFIGEFLLLMGIYTHNAWYAAVAGLTLILGACYMFRLYRNVFLGEISIRKMEGGDAVSNENWVLIPLCLAVIAIGIYPSMLLKVSESSVQQLLQIVNNHQQVLGAL